jgi:hypothetical protein
MVVATEFAIGLGFLVITFRIHKIIAVEFRATIYIPYNHCLAIGKMFVVLCE